MCLCTFWPARNIIKQAGLPQIGLRQRDRAHSLKACLRSTGIVMTESDSSSHENEDKKYNRRDDTLTHLITAQERNGPPLSCKITRRKTVTQRMCREAINSRKYIQSHYQDTVREIMLRSNQSPQIYPAYTRPLILPDVRMNPKFRNLIPTCEECIEICRR